MPYPLSLPTTSNISHADFTSSNTHPSLPLEATSRRAVLRNVLKAHRKLAPNARSANLGVLPAAIQEYLPYLAALATGLGGGTVHDEEVDVTLKSEIQVPWRTTLTSITAGRPSTRVKGKGIDFEICFTLTTLAFVYNAQARAQLLSLYGDITPDAEQRTGIINASTRLLLDASSIHAYLSSRMSETDASAGVVETLSQTQCGLAALALAEATLLAVLKDDPYPAVVVQDRNKNDKEWMIKPPEILKVRAHLFARLCLAAADHAGKAEAMFSASGRFNEDVVTYAKNLKKASKARACRFFGIDAEISGETGKAIAWLNAGKKQLGFGGSGDETSKLKGISSKFKKNWTERREDKKLEKGGDWGLDAGRLEEYRVIDMLDQKWNKMNDTINTQIVPPSDPLLANLPSGRDVHSVKPFKLPLLGEEALRRMRAPPDLSRFPRMNTDDESSDDERAEGDNMPPGAFPGTSMDGSQNSEYY